MSGIFASLNVANKGLMASQTGLHTTGHNISNANTDGYSRQRVDFKADLSFNYAGVGQLGTGVKMEAVERMVDDYVSGQIRDENGILQRFSSKAEILAQLEIIFNEPSDTSLNFNITEMFDAWQELSKNPEDLTSASKTIVVEKSKTLAETFNHIMSQMDSLKDETRQLIGNNVNEFNANIEKLETLNRQIFNITVKGHKANDLLDQRDLLLKDLSSISNFKVEEDDYGRVSMGIGGDSDEWNILEAGKSRNKLLVEETQINIVSLDETTEIKTDIEIKSGEIKGRLEALDDLSKRKGDLSKFGHTLAAAVNEVHGVDVENSVEDFFVFEGGELSVNESYLSDPSQIIAGLQTASPEGDGSRALAISNLRNIKLVFEEEDFSGGFVTIENGKFLFDDESKDTTIGNYYNELITNIGISKEQADNTVANQEILLGQLELRRESTSGVNIDEEVTNLIKFNSAYAANARVISTLTQMLDVLIGMGV